MIWNMNPDNLQGFGTVLSEKELLGAQGNSHCILLMPGITHIYRTVADTWLHTERGQAVLSVSTDGEQFRDLYLDKPVRLKKGIGFTLTALYEKASVQMAGFSLPMDMGVKTAQTDFTLRPQLQVQCLYSCQYQEREQGFVLSGEEHDMTELIYVDRGSLHSVADGMDLLLEQGDMVLYTPGQWHMQYAPLGVEPRYVRICFRVTGNDLSVLKNRVLHPSQQATVLLQNLLREQERTEVYAGDMILSLLNLLLITVLRQKGADRLQATHCVNKENQIIHRAQQYISTHVREKLSVPVVAKNAQVSPSYLTALFQKHLQISPGEYIRRIKLQESKQMIREGEMNLSQIASALQYSTIHHFSRQFKEKFGISPSEYAKSVK